MRKILIVALCALGTPSIAQFGVSFHQSNMPFLGFNYEIADRFLPEIRLGMDTFLDDMSVEAVATYQFIDKEDVEVYAGLGGRANRAAGLVAPVGVHLFPFSAKKFGFHIELTPIFMEDADSPLIRGSWGIRYRFK